MLGPLKLIGPFAKLTHEVKEMVGQDEELQRPSKLILATTLIALQALTIGALLWHRRRRRRAEDEAVQRGHELARAGRFAVIGELSASIAHEVRQPLGAILSNTGAAELLLEVGSTNTTELRAIMGDVRRDALRANEVILRLRALLEKHDVEHAPLNLHEALDEAVRLVEPEARRRGIRIGRDFAAADSVLLGDRIQLQQVLLNLAINAMDAMQEMPAARRVLEVSTRPLDHGIELHVADSGHGITASDQDRLFESFFTTKERGMGLGLSIVRTIVEAHGGRVWVEPRVFGCLFGVWLPQRHKARDAVPVRGLPEITEGAAA